MNQGIDEICLAKWLACSPNLPGILVGVLEGGHPLCAGQTNSKGVFETDSLNFRKKVDKITFPTVPHGHCRCHKELWRILVGLFRFLVVQSLISGTSTSGWRGPIRFRSFAVLTTAEACSYGPTWPGKISSRALIFPPRGRLARGTLAPGGTRTAGYAGASTTSTRWTRLSPLYQRPRSTASRRAYKLQLRVSPA